MYIRHYINANTNKVITLGKCDSSSCEYQILLEKNNGMLIEEKYLSLFELHLKDNSYINIEYEEMRCNIEECICMFKTEDEKKMIINQIGSGLMKLHSLSIIHGNLNPSNIYIDNNNNVKLIDYMFSPKIEDSSYNSCYFQSLEILLGKEYTESADSWSFGCIIYFILTERYLFTSKSIKELAKSINHFSLHISPYESSSIFNILPYLLCVSPIDRISIEEALNLINQPDFLPNPPLSTQTYQSLALLNDEEIHKMLAEYYSKTKNTNLSSFSYKQCIRKPSVFSLLLPKYASLLNVINRINDKKVEYDNLFESEITSIYCPPIGLKNVVESCLNIFEVFDIESDLKNVYSIDALSESLFFLTNLTELNLEYCDIGVSGISKLSMQFKYIPKLEILNLRESNIGDKGAKYLSKHIAELINLKTLILEDNDLKIHGIKQLSETLKYLTKLEYLNVGYNSISTYGLIYLSNVFHFLLNIKHISFHAITSSIAIHHSAVSIFFRSIRRLKKLEILNYRSNEVKSIGCQYLSESLKYYSSLKKINLLFSGINEYGIAYIVRKFKYLTHLEKINLRNNPLGNKGIIALSEYLSRLVNLKCLNLECIIYKSVKELSDEAMKGLVKSLQSLTKLEVLDLERNKISSIGIGYLCDILSCLTNLEILNIPGNEIGYDGSECLSKQLKFITKLKVLNLESTDIRPDGLSLICDSINNLSNLNTLKLGSCMIGDTGLSYFSLTVCYIPLLHTLDLENNSITDNGIRSFSRTMSLLTNLQYLNLKDNHITTMGIKRVAKLLKMKLIPTIYLENNKMEVSSFDAICKVFNPFELIK